ncbi:MAG: zinc ribbon domain-containing protein, partial [SAR324 cluster bacterium]|nr:zinc ribbon domain-containing protein [SAR324 cluster bacterium]
MDAMICAKCQGSNPDSNRFCEHCGATLERRCPQCGEAISPTAQFCGACGHGLSQDAAPSEPAPEEPTPAPSGERRQATVLFSDLSGFTAMTEKLDPEEVQGLMRRL